MLWTWLQHLQHDTTLPFRSLVGPIYFSKMQRGSKTIYLIGDLHIRQPTSHCARQPAIGVSDFLQLAAKLQPSTPMDIFVEISEDDYIANDRTPQRQELFQVNYDLDRCKSSKKSRRQCQYPNIKYHWIDVRQKSLLPLLDAFEYPDNFRYEIREFRKMWPELMTTYNTKESFAEHLKTRAVEKQLTKIPNAEVRQILQDDMMSCFNLEKYTPNVFNDKLAGDIDAYLSNPKASPKSLRQKPSFRRLENFLYKDYLLKEACLLDVYVLGRMFKSEAENIIVYAGDLHIQHVRRVLQAIGFRATFEKRSRNQCVDISRLPLPLFP